jgi:hypothetical protein
MGSLLAALDDKLPQLYSHSEYEKLVNSINEISRYVFIDLVS